MEIYCPEGRKGNMETLEGVRRSGKLAELLIVARFEQVKALESVNDTCDGWAAMAAYNDYKYWKHCAERYYAALSE
jgi:hypothetical protein